MNKYICLLLLFLIIKISVSQPDYNPSPQTWNIDAETAPCGDINNNECLLYKSTSKKEFEILNEKIEGFDYEKGYLYTIIVKQEIKQPPIAVGESVFKYVLVKIVSKKNVQKEYPISSAAFSTPISANEKILEINFETVPCETGNSKSCLLVREQGKKEFEIFNTVIYGFNYEAGNNYQIIVKPTTDGNYYFVREISKKNIKSEPAIKLSSSTNQNITNTGKVIGKTNIQTSSGLDKKWYLRKMKESEQSSFVTDDNVMWIEINSFNNHLKGFGACNEFESVVRTDLVSTFQIDKLTTGYKNCGNKKIEDIFYSLLQQADGFEIRDGNLVLSKRWSYLLEFSANPNNTTISATTADNSNNTYTAPQQITTNDVQNSITSAELLAKAKELEALKKQAAEQKALKEKAEQEAILQKQKEAADAAKKAEMQKEIDRIQKEMDEINKPKSATTTTVQKTETTTKITNSKPKETIIIKPANDNSFPNPNVKDVIYYEKNNNLISLINTSAIYKGNDKNAYLEIIDLESPTQFNENERPKLIVKLEDNETPEKYISLYICSFNFKTNKRQVDIKSQKNTINLSFSEIKPNIYEIILPKNLAVGEYAFVTNKNTANEFNISSTTVSCFGIKEEANSGKQKKGKENTKTKEENTTDCKPDVINVDKITKEKKEFWTLKLASSFVFTDKAKGKDQFIFYFQLIKIESKQYFSLVVQKTASMVSQLLQDDYVFEKGNTVLFGLTDAKPYEMIITDVYKDKKVYDGSRQVVTLHYLIHEIKEDEIPYVKDLLTNKNIDAIRIVLNDGTMINKDIKEKKSEQLINKANCFFEAIEH